MSLSTKNINFENLQSHRSYIGQVEELIQFSTCIATVNCDKQTTLTFIQSQNKTRTSKHTYHCVIGLNTIYIDITQPYGQFILENVSLTTSTYCQFTVMLKPYISDVIVSSEVFNGSVLNNGTSLSVTNKKSKTISVFGNTSVLGVLKLQYSNDNFEFFDTQNAYTLTTSGDFGYNIDGLACKYLRLKWVGSTSTIKAIISMI
jgi:hypothetical protein